MRWSYPEVGESEISWKFYSIAFNWVQLYCIHCVLFASLCVRVAWIPWPKWKSALVANTPECWKQTDVKGRESGWRGQSSSSGVLANTVFQFFVAWAWPNRQDGCLGSPSTLEQCCGCTKMLTTELPSVNQSQDWMFFCLLCITLINTHLCSGNRGENSA